MFVGDGSLDTLVIDSLKAAVFSLPLLVERFVNFVILRAAGMQAATVLVLLVVEGEGAVVVVSVFTVLDADVVKAVVV